MKLFETEHPIPPAKTVFAELKFHNLPKIKHPAMQGV